MSSGGPKVLVLCYGNPGRLDDGLGPALAASLERRSSERLTVDANYQLSVEDAATVAEHDVVIFADASVSGPDPFLFNRVDPRPALSFSSHSIEPPALLSLAEELFGARVRGYALGIRGHEFNEFGERLSRQAQENLSRALDFLQELLESEQFEDAAKRHSWPAESAERFRAEETR